MARWLPPDLVGAKETLGRRLFDEPLLAGAHDQKSFSGLDLNHFLDDRDVEWSVDRLGRTNPEKQVLSYLRQRGDAAGRRFSKEKQFNGWATAKAELLRAPPKGRPVEVIASPIDDGDDENIFHAHAVRSDQDPYDFALHMRHLFTKYGSIQLA